jgi:hypothetical protein
VLIPLLVIRVKRLPRDMAPGGNKPGHAKEFVY